MKLEKYICMVQIPRFANHLKKHYMNLIQFIDHVLITEIDQIQNEHGQHKYISFGLMSQGIELLGSLGDKEEFNMDRPGESANRFNRGLNDFFGPEYRPYTDKNNDHYLYKNLRCGLLHIVVPKAKIALGEIAKDKGIYEHLNIYEFTDGSKRLVLLAETFYLDFKKACEQAIELIREGTIMAKYPQLGSASLTKREIVGLTRDFLNTTLVLK
jgi:hypothetical protein